MKKIKLFLSIKYSRYFTMLAILVGVLVFQNCSSSFRSHQATPDGSNNPYDAQGTIQANFGDIRLPENIKHFGYFQAYSKEEMGETAMAVNTVLMEVIDADRLAEARRLGLRVFLSLQSIFFVDSQYSDVEFASESIYMDRWNKSVGLLRQYADIIDAYIPKDEPEFTYFPGTRADRPGGRYRSRADCLELIAALIRKDIPGAKMAVNFWGDTVNNWKYDTTDFYERYPRSYDYVGAENYGSFFSFTLYNTLQSLTAGLPNPPKIYLVPKSFFADTGLFFQVGGEDGIIEKHLIAAIKYASDNKRVSGFFPFVWRSFTENGSRLKGINELPKVRSFLDSLGARTKNDNPNPGPTNPPNPVPDTSGNILGVIDGISPLGDISGWACEHGASRSIDIHVYAGGPAGSGTFIVAAKADLPSEQPVASACGDPTLTPHRFQFRVPTSVPASNYVGKKIYVHGINNRGNDLLVNSGNFTFIGQETSPQQPPVNNPPQNPPAGKKIYKLQDAAAKTELWPASYLLDDNKYSCYSSNPGDMNNSQGEFIAAWFNLGSIVTIDKVMITPRIVDGKTIGFPSSFRLYVTTPDNLSWMLVRDFNKTDLPKDANGDYLLQLPQSYQTWGIHIVPNQLGTDDFNHYYFQLCGLKAGYL